MRHNRKLQSGVNSRVDTGQCLFTKYQCKSASDHSQRTGDYSRLAWKVTPPTCGPDTLYRCVHKWIDVACGSAPAAINIPQTI